MSKKKLLVSLDRKSGDFHFEGLGADKIAVPIDAAAAIGGTNLGARPMELLLMGLGGCSAIDVVMILKKSKQVIEDLKITIEGERDADAIPAPFEKIHLKFFFKGDIKVSKIEEAIRLSMEKYCSAVVMLSKTAEISWSYELEKV
ncbi:MAG: OsmC family protein [Saprospiraceae bacterium]